MFSNIRWLCHRLKQDCVGFQRKALKNQTLLEELFRWRLGPVGFRMVMVRYPTLGRIPTIGTACPRSFGLERRKKIIYRPSYYCGVVRGH